MTVELLERLSGTDPGAAQAAAGRLLGYASQLRDAASRSEGLPPVGWVGRGATAARQHTAELARTLRQSADDCESAALALRAVALAVASYRAQVDTARRVLAVETAAGLANPYGAETARAAVLRELADGWAYLDGVDRRAAGLVSAATVPRLFPRPAAVGVLSLPATPARSQALLTGAMAMRVRPVEPGAVAVWWAGLDPSARSMALDGWGVLYGSGDGLPVEVRDAYNRRRLADALLAAQARAGRVTAGDLTRQLAGDVAQVLPWPLSRLASGATGPTQARRRLAELTAVAEVAAEPGRRLLVFEPPQGSDDGRVVIATGDVGRARSVAVLVPGMNTDLSDAPRLDDQVARVADAAGPGSVGVMWLGYDAPGIREVVSDGTARQAAPALDSFVSGLRAVAGGVQRVTVVGHSYGSLVVGLAARRASGTLQADELVFAGSPGVGSRSVAELGLTPGRVWAVRAPTDPIQLVFWPGAVARRVGLPGAFVYGPDPTSAAFGARLLDTGGLRGHSSYFDTGTRTLPEIGAVVAGRPVRGQVTG